jgi:hypothetical protein
MLTAKAHADILKTMSSSLYIIADMKWLNAK